MIDVIQLLGIIQMMKIVEVLERDHLISNQDHWDTCNHSGIEIIESIGTVRLIIFEACHAIEIIDGIEN